MALVNYQVILGIEILADSLLNTVPASAGSNSGRSKKNPVRTSNVHNVGHQDSDLFR